METPLTEPSTFLCWLREHAQAIPPGDAATAIGILQQRFIDAAPSVAQIQDGSAVVFLLRGQLMHGVVAHTTPSGIASIEVRRYDGGLDRMKVPVRMLRPAPGGQHSSPR